MSKIEFNISQDCITVEQSWQMVEENNRRQSTVLCLHGNQQNNEVFRTRLGRLSKKLRKVVHLEFLESTISLPLQTGEEVAMKTWWNFSKKDSEYIVDFESIESTLTQVENHILFLKEEGIIVKGILGFSMGAALATLIASKLQRFSSIDFSILFSCPNVSFFVVNEKIKLTSLHVYGKQDKLVLPSASLEVASYFETAQIHEHNQGHCIPSKAVDHEVILQFVRNQLEKSSFELSSEQEEELEALNSIYAEDNKFSLSIGKQAKVEYIWDKISNLFSYLLKILSTQSKQQKKNWILW
eukprot:snap_masked-scaffold_47-processed-gene-1.71-mRNA-1 protein AED:1.00 eAED:1.00 QI:0/0/0/0/1/1/4/0/297